MVYSPSHFVVMGPSQQIPTSSVTADLDNVVGAPCSEKIGQAPPENEHGRPLRLESQKIAQTLEISSFDQQALAANPQMIEQIGPPVPKRRLETQISGAATDGNYEKLGEQFWTDVAQSRRCSFWRARAAFRTLTSHPRSTCLISSQDCTIVARTRERVSTL